MIVIKKPGKKPKKYKTIYEIECTKCGCVFECEDSDFTSIERKLDGKVSIKCPCCGEELTFVSRSVLKSRQEEIPEPIPNVVPSPFGPHPDYDPWRYPDYPDPFDEWIHKYTPPKDPCDTCPHRDGPKDALGNPTVGDSPCQWCPHYKWKVTWITNTCNGSVSANINDTTTSYIEKRK